MKKSTKILALGAAYATCCAIPIAGLLFRGAFAGSAPVSLGLETVEGAASLSATSLAAFLLLLRWRHPRTSRRTSIENSCGCPGAGITAQPGQATGSAPIACTLMPGDFKERVEWIRRLAQESLLSVRREPLALHLNYDIAAAAGVHELVGKEETCCTFLRFNLGEDTDGIHLTITAPEEARAVANELFAHFAPELARSHISSSSK